jgi:hypothetical protein
MDQVFVVVGSDGLDFVVWGVGATPDEARADARVELSSSGYDPREANGWEVVEVPKKMILAIRDGHVNWEELRVLYT